MKTLKVTLAVWIILFSVSSTMCSEKTTLPGGGSPGLRATPFGGERINSGLNERDTALSPDGRWLFYTVWEFQRGTLVVMEHTDNGWTDPKVAPFSGVHSDLEPCFGPDGDFYFISFRKDNVARLFRTRYGDTGWATVEPVSLPVPDGVNIFYPSFTTDGDIYFTAELPDSLGGEDLYKCPKTETGYGKPVNLGAPVNSANAEYNAFVSPDGSFILYNTHGAGPGIGHGDIWVSFHDQKGWHKPLNLGEAVNSTAFEYCPSLTPDGRILFFTSQRTTGEIPERITLEWMKQRKRSAGNGQGDLYWVSSKVIEDLRPTD